MKQMQIGGVVCGAARPCSPDDGEDQEFCIVFAAMGRASHYLLFSLTLSRLSQNPLKLSHLITQR